MTRLTRTIGSLLLLFSLIVLNAIPANAWGPAGHRIVAGIAQRHLTPHARQKIAQILGQHVTLASVANFADAIRNSQPATKPYHYVDIPKDETNYDPSQRYCTDQQNHHNCALAVLERFKQDVVNPHKTPAQRQFALKFIIHLVGDMHQPLHCSDNNDGGGNALHVRFFNQSTDLHHLWDSDLITRTGLSVSAYVNFLDSGLSDQEIDSVQQGTTIQWALESHTLARTNAYDSVVSHANLGQAYFATNKPVVDTQLRRGGLRLAKVLNDLFP